MNDIRHMSIHNTHIITIALLFDKKITQHCHKIQQEIKLINHITNNITITGHIQDDENNALLFKLNVSREARKNDIVADVVLHSLTYYKVTKYVTLPGRIVVVV